MSVSSQFGHCGNKDEQNTWQNCVAITEYIVVTMVKSCSTTTRLLHTFLSLFSLFSYISVYCHHCAILRMNALTQFTQSTVGKLLKLLKSHSPNSQSLQFLFHSTHACPFNLPCMLYTLSSKFQCRRRKNIFILWLSHHVKSMVKRWLKQMFACLAPSC